MNENVIRVMVVDDHEMVRRVMSVFVRYFDTLLLVGEAATGVEAVEQCENLKPDVILMDVSMPVMDGIEATHIIRQTYPDTQVIMLTSVADETKAKEALRVGAFSYLPKGISVHELFDTICAAVKHGAVHRVAC